MSRRVIRVDPVQAAQKLAQLRDEMERVEQAPPPEPEDDGKSLDQLVEDELKRQLRASKVEGYTIVNAIRFLAVKARLPVVYGTELDQ